MLLLKVVWFDMITQKTMKKGLATAEAFHFPRNVAPTLHTTQLNAQLTMHN